MIYEYYWKAARVISLYHANVPAMEWAEEMQKRVEREWVTSYLREKLDDYALGFHHLFPTFDYERQRIHMNIMWDRYGAEVDIEWAFVSNQV